MEAAGEGGGEELRALSPSADERGLLYERRARLTVVDDESQRDAAGNPTEERNAGDGSRKKGSSAEQDEAGGFSEALRAVLDATGLRRRFVHKAPRGSTAANAHTLFRNGSLGLVWNDAQWDEEFLRRWWPLLDRDGGMLLLHNVIGNGELSRWCVASPRRVLQRLFPGEKFEFLTLLEPHKAWQGSVAMLRRLDPELAPDKYAFLWGRGGLDADESGSADGEGLPKGGRARLERYWIDMLDRRPAGAQYAEDEATATRVPTTRSGRES